MVVTDWHEVIQMLWAALKSFLTFAQQQEHNLINDKLKIPRLKPLLPKDKKPVAAAVILHFITVTERCETEQ